MLLASDNTDFTKNSWDTILHKVKDRAHYKSGIMSPEYSHSGIESTFLPIPGSATCFAIIDNACVQRSYKLKMDNDSGDVVRNLQDHSGHYHTVTSANEADGCLWLGSLIQPHAARIPVP